MKWLKRVLKGVAYLLLLLLLAAVGFREWCVLRLPSMRKEVNDAWRDYAGIALDDVPKRFPSLETNEAALNLEKAAAKLGICLSPVKYDQKCIRNAPPITVQDEFAGLVIKDAKGEERSMLTDYLNREMEKGSPSIEPLPAGLAQFLAAHHVDLEAARRLLLSGEPVRWGYKTEVHEFNSAINLLGHLKLYRLLALDAFAKLAEHRSDDVQLDLDAMEKLEATLNVQPQVVNVLIEIAEHRMFTAVVREDLDGTAAKWESRLKKPDWNELLRKAQVYETWKLSSTEAILRLEQFESKLGETTDVSVLENPWKPATLGHRIWSRITRPWIQISFLQMSTAFIRDGKRLAAQDRCHPITNAFDLPGITLTEPVWYKPFTSGVQHPSFSWWNPIGKIIYAIVMPNSGTWARAARMDLETELSVKVMMLHGSRPSYNSLPASIPGIEISMCKNEKWSYTLTKDDTAMLNFSGRPDWGTMKGPKVPLQWSEAALAIKIQPNYHGEMPIISVQPKSNPSPL